jgi:hypothetical protein
MYIHSAIAFMIADCNICDDNVCINAICKGDTKRKKKVESKVNKSSTPLVNEKG